MNNPFSWNIQLVRRDDPRLIVNKQACRGVVIYSQRLILIDKTLTEVDMPKVIRHELSHAIIYSTQLDTRPKKRYTEEDLCEFMAKYGDIIVEQVDKLMEDLEKHKCIESGLGFLADMMDKLN